MLNYFRELQEVLVLMERLEEMVILDVTGTLAVLDIKYLNYIGYHLAELGDGVNTTKIR